MRINGVRENQNLFTVKMAKLDGEAKERAKKTIEKILLSLIQVDTLADMPYSLSRPSNTPIFRRANIDKELRLYWRLDEDRNVIFHDICSHKEAKNYKDVHP